MSLLRIHASLTEPPGRCRWVLLDGDREPVKGEGQLADLPRHADRVQLVVPAAQVLIAQTRLPPNAQRNAGSLLAFALEDRTASDPDANRVARIAAVGNQDVLAVIDKKGLERWCAALEHNGMRADEVQCEALLLPFQAGAWGVAWNGHDGFVRCGQFQAAAMDCGDAESPPLALRLLLDEAQENGLSPTAIALYLTPPATTVNVAAWQVQLGVELRLAGPWDWRARLPDAGVFPAQPRHRWSGFSGIASRLRPAAWMLVAAMAIHAVAMITDWSLLAGEQRTLRKTMESQFRAVFPDAIAVVDPVLQMRRKLIDAHRAAGVADSGDFLPLIENVAQAIKDLPAGSLRSLAYESGRMTIELAASQESTVHRVEASLTQSGYTVERSTPSSASGGGTIVLVVRTS